MAKTNDDIEKEFPADGRSGAACANGACADACSGVPPEPGRVDGLFDRCPELLTALLKDHTTSTPERQANIFWATDDYASLGEGYRFADPITACAITGERRDVVRPRALKSREVQQQRTQDKAEVFTPSWLCNKQNNLIDAAWFGREHVFNTEIDHPDGTHSWEPTEGRIAFPDGKSWRDYVGENRLEITCGEAPYLVSRYDAVTGEPIPIGRRIGLLDRKLRVVGENTATSAEWLEAAQAAYKSVYGYEWQGDSLLLARQALLLTFVDYYQAKFGRMPLERSMLYIAYIVSWNLWQMDGLRGVIPGSCGAPLWQEEGLFGEAREGVACPGCEHGDIRKHNGTYALVRDWKTKNANRRTMRFIDLIKHP